MIFAYIGNHCMENPKFMCTSMLLEMHSVVCACVGRGVVKEGRGSTDAPP